MKVRAWKSDEEFDLLMTAPTLAEAEAFVALGLMFNKGLGIYQQIDFTREDGTTIGRVKDLVVYAGCSSNCNFCGDRFHRVMYDFSAKMSKGRIWGNGCSTCFHKLDGSLGTGHGQKYVLATGFDKWVKVSG